MGIAATPPRGPGSLQFFYFFVEKTIWRAAIVSEQLTTAEGAIMRPQLERDLLL